LFGLGADLAARCNCRLWWRGCRTHCRSRRARRWRGTPPGYSRGQAWARETPVQPCERPSGAQAGRLGHRTLTAKQGETLLPPASAAGLPEELRRGDQDRQVLFIAPPTFQGEDVGREPLLLGRAVEELEVEDFLQRRPRLPPGHAGRPGLHEQEARQLPE